MNHRKNKNIITGKYQLTVIPTHIYCYSYCQKLLRSKVHVSVQTVAFVFKWIETDFTHDTMGNQTFCDDYLVSPPWLLSHLEIFRIDWINYRHFFLLETLMPYCLHFCDKMHNEQLRTAIVCILWARLLAIPQLLFIPWFALTSIFITMVTSHQTCLNGIKYCTKSDLM